MELNDYRCYLSNRLLCKAAGHGQIEIMNPENRMINYVGPSRTHQDVGPKGQEFQKDAVDLRCKKCKRLQARAIGTDLVVEIKCKYCHETTLHELNKMESSRMATFSTAQKAEFDKHKTDTISNNQNIGVETYIKN